MSTNLDMTKKVASRFKVAIQKFLTLQTPDGDVRVLDSNNLEELAVQDSRQSDRCECKVCLYIAIEVDLVLIRLADGDRGLVLGHVNLVRSLLVNHLAVHRLGHLLLLSARLDYARVKTLDLRVIMLARIIVHCRLIGAHRLFILVHLL